MLGAEEPGYWMLPLLLQEISRSRGHSLSLIHDSSSSTKSQETAEFIVLA